jgi:hypothetical protein
VPCEAVIIDGRDRTTRMRQNIANLHLAYVKKGLIMHLRRKCPVSWTRSSVRAQYMFVNNVCRRAMDTAELHICEVKWMPERIVSEDGVVDPAKSSHALEEYGLNRGDTCAFDNRPLLTSHVPYRPIGLRSLSEAKTCVLSRTLFSLENLADHFLTTKLWARLLHEMSERMAVAILESTRQRPVRFSCLSIFCPSVRLSAACPTVRKCEGLAFFFLPPPPPPVLAFCCGLASEGCEAITSLPA